MNKYIKKVEDYKQKTLEKALETLREEYKEARINFSETGYDRYQKKMDKIEEQIDEIEKYLGIEFEEPIELKANIYKQVIELREAMSTVKSKVFYLSKDIPMCTELFNLQEFLKDF